MKKLYKVTIFNSNTGVEQVIYLLADNAQQVEDDGYEIKCIEPLEHEEI